MAEAGSMVLPMVILYKTFFEVEYLSWASTQSSLRVSISLKKMVDT
jgi:hypothetical protein